MQKKFTIYPVLGLFIGAVFGTAFVPVLENDIPGIAAGALVGIFIGWYIAAAMQKNNTEER